MRCLCKPLIGGLISDLLLRYTKITPFQSQHQVSRTSLATTGQSKVHQRNPSACPRCKLSADWRNKVYIFAWKVGSSLFYHEQTKEKQPVPFQSFVWMARAEAFPVSSTGDMQAPAWLPWPLSFMI
jgi:hypothetical protein